MLTSTTLHAFIYVIQCSTEVFGEWAYYIGSYRGWDIVERFRQHCIGHENQTRGGALFTMKYAPERLIHVEMVSKRDMFRRENELTREYFLNVPNSLRLVRGGDYVSMEADCHTPARLKHWFPKELLDRALNGDFGKVDPDVDLTDE